MQGKCFHHVERAAAVLDEPDAEPLECRATPAQCRLRARELPSTHDENLRRLGLALDDLNARRRDGKQLTLERDLTATPVLELDTEAGELKLVAEPPGTRGYDDLRRAAVREPLGEGLRPSVASVGDLARMLSALGREHDRQPLRTLRHIAELERSLGRGIER